MSVKSEHIFERELNQTEYKIKNNNKIKERLTLTEATWTCSDEISFKDFDKAILHEREIMEQEQKKEV